MYGTWKHLHCFSISFVICLVYPYRSHYMVRDFLGQLWWWSVLSPCASAPQPQCPQREIRQSWKISWKLAHTHLTYVANASPYSPLRFHILYILNKLRSNSLKSGASQWKLLHLWLFTNNMNHPFISATSNKKIYAETYCLCETLCFQLTFLNLKLIWAAHTAFLLPSH